MTTICGECGKELWGAEYEDRHSDGDQEYCYDCCPVCEQEAAE